MCLVSKIFWMKSHKKYTSKVLMRFSVDLKFSSFPMRKEILQSLKTPKLLFELLKFKQKKLIKNWVCWKTPQGMKIPRKREKLFATLLLDIFSTHFDINWFNWNISMSLKFHSREKFLKSFCLSKMLSEKKFGEVLTENVLLG